MGDAHMSGIMGREHDLMPKQSQQHRRCHVPFCSQSDDKQREECRVSQELLAVLAVSTVIEPLVLDPLMKLLVFDGDVALRGRVQGWVVFKVTVDFFLLYRGGVGCRTLQLLIRRG